MSGSKRLAVQVVDFFSGCGGMSYGFANAPTKKLQYEIVAAVDIDQHANATFEKMLGVKPTQTDVRKLRSKAVLRGNITNWGLDTRKPLIVIGCAPCQGFSSHRKKDPRLDKRNDLLAAFARVCGLLRPEVVIMENVPEIFQDSHWRHFAAWRKTLESLGYSVRARIYNLAEFGVPQERFRAVIIAARDWKHFRMPQALRTTDKFSTVRTAIGHLPHLQVGQTDSADPMHITSRHRPDTIELIKLIPPDGGSRRALPDNVGPRCLRKVDGFRDVYGRLAWDKPAVAITARCRTPSCGRYIHPDQHRGLSVREAALLQGFPPEYFFEGPFDDKFKQIGNAVSPIFSTALALHIDNEWFQDHKEMTDERTARDIVGPIAKSFSSSIASIKRKMRNNEVGYSVA
jgi:DNA (cytosine-5)-methyltransferase 1